MNSNSEVLPEKQMKKASLPFKQLASILFFILILPNNRVFSQEQTTVVSDIEKRIAQINDQITRLKARLNEEEKRESSLLSTLEKIRLNKKVLQNEIESLNLRRSLVLKQLIDLKNKTRELKITLEKEQEAVERTLVTLYRYGRLDFMHFFLKASSLETFLRESKNLTFLARYQGEAISSYFNTLSELQALEKELQAKMAEADLLLQQAIQNQEKLNVEERKNQKLLEEIKRNKSTYQKMMVELQESSEQLQQLLRRLQSQEIALPSPFIPLNERKGKLPWPLEGKIITRFGPERHPRFNTVTINNGIEIAPSRDKVVRAVHGGRVVFADYFKGYGNLIIVDHGLSYYTLYGHLSSFQVKVGDLVQAGQPIGQAGDSDSIKGESLYFEIRHKSQAVDPLQWLRRR
jgi:septal ring factor EnvC (AmiA/AmiB activator)